MTNEKSHRDSSTGESNKDQQEVSSCMPGMSRREFCGRLIKRATVAGTLAVALSSVNFHDHKAIAASTFAEL